MAAAANAGGARGAGRMGIQNGQVVQEFGDGGADGETLRAEIEHITGTPVLDADADDVVDVVLLWWREEDGDLADGVVDVLDALEDDGTMWVLTPKSGRDGHVSASDVDEAAAIAGLHVTSTNMVGNDWTAARLTAPKGTPKGT